MFVGAKNLGLIDPVFLPQLLSVVHGPAALASPGLDKSLLHQNLHFNNLPK